MDDPVPAKAKDLSAEKIKCVCCERDLTTVRVFPYLINGVGRLCSYCFYKCLDYGKLSKMCEFSLLGKIMEMVING